MHFFAVTLNNFLGSGLRVKALSNTNLVASRHIKGEKGSLPADERRCLNSLLTHKKKLELVV